MKKYSLLLLIFAFVPVKSHAQTIKAEIIKVWVDPLQFDNGQQVPANEAKYIWYISADKKNLTQITPVQDTVKLETEGNFYIGCKGQRIQNDNIIEETPICWSDVQFSRIFILRPIGQINYKVIK